MDKKRIQSLIEDKMKDIQLNSLSLFFEDDQVLRIEVVSNDFKGQRILQRIERISSILLDVSMNELYDYQLIYNPLTENEKKNGVDEIGGSDEEFTPKRKNFVASPAL